ncbi:MAG TPA: hypothetical protein VMA13_00680, partial [Candidatus Saccharimonadales bacterium]|nr:hypothetical protein [Candidatus Saccharimonadales bacterium]
LVSDGITIGTGTAGGTLSVSSSMMTLLGGTIGTPSAPHTTLNLDGATLQLNADGNNAVGDTNVAVIAATTVNTNAPTTINIASAANVSSVTNIPLISYTGTDPYGDLILGTYPAGYTATLVDDTGNSSIDLSIASSVLPPPPTPRITSVSLRGTTLNISATNGAYGGQYILLGTTNVAMALTNWTPLLTNNFDGSGNLNLSTNIINPAVPHEFFILLQQQ